MRLTYLYLEKLRPKWVEWRWSKAWFSGEFDGSMDIEWLKC